MSKNQLQILPVRKEELPEEDLNPILPKPPFCCVFTAPPRAGKSNAIINMLANKNFYYNGKGDNPSYFDEIFYFSPTSKFDRTTKRVLDMLDNVVQINDLDDLNNSFEIVSHIMDGQARWDESIEGKPRPKILLVFDDMVGLFEKTGVSNLATKYRHFGLSIIVVSQSYRRLPVTLRNCATVLIWFNLMSGKENTKLYEEFGSSIPDFWTHLKLLDKKYQFLYFHIEDQMLYHNFETLIWSKDDYLS